MTTTYYVHHNKLGLIKDTKNETVARLVMGGYAPGVCVIEVAKALGGTPSNPYGGIELSYIGDPTGFRSIG
jgi:hypothetical protein